jgi:hypothetical protein
MRVMSDIAVLHDDFVCGAGNGVCVVFDGCLTRYEFGDYAFPSWVASTQSAPFKGVLTVAMV